MQNIIGMHEGNSIHYLACHFHFLCIHHLIIIVIIYIIKYILTAILDNLYNKTIRAIYINEKSRILLNYRLPCLTTVHAEQILIHKNLFQNFIIFTFIYMNYLYYETMILITHIKLYSV